MQFDENSKVSQKEEVIFANLDDNIAMMHVESGAYYDFDDVASEIWRQIDKPISVANLCDKLCEEFDISPEACRADTIEFLESLSNLDLITVTPAS